MSQSIEFYFIKIALKLFEIAEKTFFINFNKKRGTMFNVIMISLSNQQTVTRIPHLTSANRLWVTSLLLLVRFAMT